MGDRRQRSAPVPEAKKRRITYESPINVSESAEIYSPPKQNGALSPQNSAKSTRSLQDPKHSSLTSLSIVNPESSHKALDSETSVDPTPSSTCTTTESLLPLKLAVQEEEQGLLSYVVVTNDGMRDSMILLTNLKIVIQHQLPKMPKEYITRLVMARNHYSMLLVKKGTNTCLGGVTFLPFVERKFAEVVFLAIDGVRQTQGYGSRLMAHLKDYVRDKFEIDYLLTYADNLAIGYFKKQGFATDITLDRSIWAGCIKDYEEATILQCTFYPKVRYTQIKPIIRAQRRAIYRKIKERFCPFVIYEGIRNFNEDGTVDPLSIPGVKESGWVPELDVPPTELQDRASLLNKFLKKVVGEMRVNPNAWPFLEPVTGVPDYYDIIKEPMDLHTISYKIDDNCYSSFESFEKDVDLIFRNCRTYNDESTLYVKCANKLEKWFKGKSADFKAEIAPLQHLSKLSE